jgi:glycosyltransferase involved in cell wall biosynthesis
MKVLFLTNIPSPYRVDFFNVLGQKCELTVLFETEYAKSRNTKWKSENVRNFNAVILKGKRVGEAEAVCPSVIQYLSDRKYDVIVVGIYSSPTGMMAIEYMRMRKIPFMLSSDGGMRKQDKGIKHKLKEHFIGSAKYWLSTGEVTTQYLNYYGADKEHIYHYPFSSIKNNDILLQPLTSDEKQSYRNKLGIKERHIVVSVGQFIHRKGYDLLMKSCKGLRKDIGIYIVGGIATDEYTTLKDELELGNFHFVGFRQKKDLVDYYKAADLFVLPTREDIWGLVVNEAMAYGLPVITTDKCVAGTQMVLNGKNGYIVSVDCDYKSLIETTVEDQELLNSMQLESLNTARRYTIEEMSKSHMEVFERFVLENRK